MRNFHFPISNFQKGQASLPSVLSLAVLILVVVVAITAFTFSESLITQSQTYSQTALGYAEAGARDALIRIARKYNYTCVATDCYSIDMVASGCATLDGCAKISVSAGTGGGGDAKIITAKGEVKNVTRRVQVDVSISTDGEITATTWTELTN
jgi:hypothetical protein